MISEGKVHKKIVETIKATEGKMTNYVSHFSLPPSKVKHHEGKTDDSKF